VKSAEIIIAGAGIIGVAIAMELRRRGAQVLVLERGTAGAEASSAAAGMLAPNDPETPPPLRPIALESARLFPDFVRQVESLSGIATDFRRHGTIAFLDAPSAPPEYTALSADDLRRFEPHLLGHGLAAFLVREDTVDPRLLMRAALTAARRLGVEFQENSAVREVRSRGNLVEVVTASGVLTAGAFIDCRGAWSGLPVRPRKGQMLYVQPPQPGLLQHVVHASEVYIVPRSSGKILLGATVEDVGFDKTVVPSTIQDLLRAGARYLPQLASAPILESWAGLRPGTPDDLPLLGPTQNGAFIASGHFRNGILLAPATAKIMADLVAGRDPGIDITAFAVSRFAPAKA
jgi:glycine oxidase